MIWSMIWKQMDCQRCPDFAAAVKKLAAVLLLLAAGLLAAAPAAEASSQLPRVAVIGFSSRVAKTDITMTDIAATPDEMLRVVRDRLETELAGNDRFDLFDYEAEVTRDRLDEAAVIAALGRGEIVPELQDKADYLVYGYLTELSNVKAQSGVLVFSGRDKTVHAELSLRVVDAHTGAVVFVTTADSRRKSELAYHAILQRHDYGAEDAVAQALDDAATNLAAQFKASM